MKRILPILAALLLAGCGVLGLGSGWSQQNTTNAWHHADGSPWAGPSEQLVLGVTASIEQQLYVQRAMHQWLAANPTCAMCGRSNHVAGCVLNCHHRKPAHLCTGADLSMLTNPVNFVSLCRDPDGIGDHGRWGHGSNGTFKGWSYWNQDLARDLAAHGVRR